MDVHEALYTTRAMRRVTSEPIPMDAQARILDAAVRAPSGGNTQNWRFLLVDSPEVKARISPLYKEAISGLWTGYYKDRIDAAHADPEAAESKSMLRTQRSAQWLADHFEEVPLYLFAFTQHDTSGSSIYPAMWSAQLAARAEGIGTSLTQALAFHNDETLEILGVPPGRAGTWPGACRSATRRAGGEWPLASPPARCRSATSGATDVGFDSDGPLWSPDS